MNHIEVIAHRKLSIMSKLAGTTWATNGKMMKTIHQGTVRPTMEYISATWSTIFKTNQQALDKVLLPLS